MKQFTITQLLLFVTWCGIACFAISRQLAKPAYEGSFEDIEGQTFYHEGVNEWLETTIDDAAIQKSPAWTPTDPNPPVSARMALSVAGRFRRERLRDEGNWKWSLTSLTLYPLDGKNNKWCWCVLFTAYPTTGGGSGMPPQFAAYILMNGEVVEPEVHENNFGALPENSPG